MEKRIFEISWISLWRVLVLVALASVIWQGLPILLGLFLAIAISSGLEFLVDFLERLGMPRTLGVITIFLVAALFVIVVVYAVIPLIIVDLSSIFSGLTKAASKAWWGPLINFKTTQSLTAIINRISSQFLAGDTSPFSAFSDVVGGIALALSVLISSFYLSLTHDGVERFIRAVFPADHEEAVLRIYARARKKIGFWFRTQIILSLTMGFLVWISLLLLGVKHAFLVGVLAAIFELVPYVGPVLSGAVAVILALAVSPSTALYTLIVFLFLHQVENHFLVPLLAGRNVGLHPVIVIIALLVGAEVGGLLGILISVPAAVVIQEIIEDWSSRKRTRLAAT